MCDNDIKIVYDSSKVLGPKRAAIKDGDVLNGPPRKARRMATPHPTSNETLATSPNSSDQQSTSEEETTIKISYRSVLPDFDSISVKSTIECGKSVYKIKKCNSYSPHGTFGKVASGRNLENDRPVAIKISKPLKGNLLEAQILSELSKDRLNKHVVKYFGHVVKDGLLYLVVEQLDRTLSDAVNAYDDFVPLHFMNKVSKQLFQGLEYLKSKGITHKDIKGNNIMLGCWDNVKFIDFGSAKMEGKKGNGLTPVASYSSPETLLGGEHSYPADLWSVGVLCLNMWAKARIFYGETDGQMLYSICSVFVVPTEPLDAPRFSEFFKLCRTTNQYVFIEKPKHKCKIIDPYVLKRNHAMQYDAGVPASYYDFWHVIGSIFKWNPQHRATPTEVLGMPFFTSFSMTVKRPSNPTSK